MDLRAVRGKKEGTYVDVSEWGGDEAQPGGMGGMEGLEGRDEMGGRCLTTECGCDCRMGR